MSSLIAVLLVWTLSAASHSPPQEDELKFYEQIKLIELTKNEAVRDELDLAEPQIDEIASIRSSASSIEFTAFHNALRSLEPGETVRVIIDVSEPFKDLQQCLTPAQWERLHQLYVQQLVSWQFSDKQGRFARRVLGDVLDLRENQLDEIEAIEDRLNARERELRIEYESKLNELRESAEREHRDILDEKQSEILLQLMGDRFKGEFDD